MDKKFTNGAKRIFAALLAMIIVSSGVPVSPLSQVFGDTVITANAEDSWSKSEANTVFGTTGIEHPQTPQENVEWRGNYVYYGKYNGNPVKYRILDADSQEFVPKKSGNIEPEDPTQKTLFLESDSFVGTDVDWNFGEKRYSWPSSVLRRQLTKDGLFYNKEGVFTPIEKSSIFTSVKLGRIWDGEKADGVGYGESMNFAALFGDTIFVLDAREATNPYYGYANTRYAHKSKSRGGWHWLRSPYDQYKGMVESDGNIEARSLMYSNVCPAFNVDLKKVLFSSRIVGDASAAYGKEYKLTLKNDNFGIGITDGDYVTYNSSSRWVSIPYTVTDSDDNINPDTVSIVITNLNGDIVYYSPVSDTYKSKGTAWVQLPTNEPSKYHVYLVAENRNGIHETDYASPMTEIHVPTTYAITYKLNGGTNNPQNPPNYIDDYGTEIYAPTRERYNFGGWYDNSAFTGEPITSIPAGSSDRKILYAKWIPCVYNVTLIKNGGTIDGDDLTQYTYTYGAVLPGITRDYYTFKGWFARDKYGNELKYTKISTSSYGDKSFYANWTANTYTIGYELNGGTADNPTSYTAENLPINLNNPTRTGYTFTGWTGTEIAGTSQNVAISDCSAGNRNYTANWSVNHYTVKFDKNNANASGTMTDQNFTCNMEQELTANGFTAPTGYHFTGWATSPNGNVAYSDTQAILNMTTEDNKEITLYAKWAANTYTIHFDKNSDLAYGEMPDQVFTYDAAPEKLSKRAFIFTTAAFLGWNTKADGSGTDYTEQQEVQNLTTVNDEVITLYAQWKRKYGVFDNSHQFPSFREK